ncbi:MAG: ATP-binding protein [Flammeovirgaceae bacterium]
MELGQHNTIQQNPSKKITRIYITAFLLIGLFSLAGQLLIRYTLASQSDDASVINIAGRQRMLSQKLVKTAMLIVQADSSADFERRQMELYVNQKLWEQSHYGLQYGDTALNIPSNYNSESIREHFVELNEHFAAMQKSLNQIKYLSFDVPRDSVRRSLTQLTTHEPGFLRVMNDITLQYTQDANEKIERLKRIELTLFCITISILLIEAFFIFRPAIGNINKFFEIASQKTQELTLANEQLAEKHLLAQQYLEQLGAQNEELKQQSEELITVNDNLKSAQTDLEETIQEKETLNEELRQNAEELLQINEVLETSQSRLKLALVEKEATHHELQHKHEELLNTLDKLELAKTELQKLAVVVQKTNNGIIITDHLGGISYVNQGFEDISGYELADIKGQNFISVLNNKSDQENAKLQIKQKFKSKAAFSLEISNRRKDGSKYWMYLNVNPVYNDKGEIINYVIIETDISESKEKEALLQAQKESLETAMTELKETQMQLVQSEKLSSIGQLTAGIAHEINNPVNFIYAGANTLRQVLNDVRLLIGKYNEIKPNSSQDTLLQKLKEIREYKERIHFDELDEDVTGLLSDVILGAERTRDIVQSLRNFTRLDENEAKPANIHENLDSTLVILNNNLKDRVEIIKEYDEYLPFIECNIGQLNQVFLNLINNASQAIEGKGTITIKTNTNQEQDTVTISIIDTGVGMDEDTINHIFDPFYTTKPIGEGTGLGLSISIKIIKSHNGEITVTSQPGQGTCFAITLPITQNHNKAAAN